MNGVAYAGTRQIVVKEFPDPRPGPGEALIRMKAAAICGSDMHAYRSLEHQQTWGLGPHRIPGHEPCGVVGEVGAGVTGVKPGDRVLVYHVTGCGRCRYCLKGELMHCRVNRRDLGGDLQGSMADCMVAPERNCLPLPAEMTYVEGALLACIGGTAYKINKSLDVSGQDSVAVFGLGPVGTAVVMMAKGRGARVLGVDRLPARLEIARAVGADELINMEECDPLAVVRELTGGEGVDVAIDASGHPKGQGNALDACRPFGRVGLVGLNLGELTVKPMWQITNRHLTIKGSHIYGLEDYHDMVEFVLGRGIKLENLVTHRFPIERAPEAFQLFETGTTGKIVFVWE